MLLTLRLFGHDIIELAATRTTDTEDSLAPPFGFAGSGTGILDLADDRALDTLDG